jgi:NADH/NAD ratio-sensing transcriptional regulator Rex
MSLTDEDLRRLDDRFVTRAECETKTDKTQEAIAKMQTDMAVMCTTQKATNKWLAVIATAIITGLIAFAMAKILGG